MLKFLLIVFLVFLFFQILWRIFGNFFKKSLIKYVNYKIQQEAINRANAFQQKFDGDYEREYMVSQNFKIKVPRTQKPSGFRKKVDDVDFEEVN